MGDGVRAGAANVARRIGSGTSCKAGEGLMIRGTSGSSSSVSSSSAIALPSLLGEVPNADLRFIGVRPPMKPERALGDWLDAPSAASYDGIGADVAVAGRYPGGRTSRLGIASGELLSSLSSLITDGLELGPASSGPGRALVLVLEVGRPLSPDSELERLFLNIDLMLLIPEGVSGSSRLIRSTGG